MSEQENLYGRSYSVQLKCDNYDITEHADIKRICINNTINDIMPKISIELQIDNNELISNNIYGEKLLQLILTNNTEANEITENELIIDFLVIQSSIPMPEKKVVCTDVSMDMVPIVLIGVILPCYKLMSTTVNTIFEEVTGLNPVEIFVETLKQKNITNVQYDKRNLNLDIVQQCLIPPMSINKAIKYLHEKYGFYCGPLHIYCNWDHDTKEAFVELFDYSAIIKDSEELTIYQFCNDDEEINKDIIEECDEKDCGVTKFYTRLPIKTSAHANLNTIHNSIHKVQIIYPDDLLYKKTSYDINNINKKFGTNEEEFHIKCNPELQNKIEYEYNLKGFNECSFTSRYSRMFMNTESVKVILQRNLCFKTLMKVGHPVKFEPSTMEYINYHGKYILHTCNMKIEKEGQQYMGTANIEMFRSAIKS